MVITPEAGRTKLERDSENRTKAIEKKESFRWLEGMRAAHEVAEACPQTTCVCIADSDADIYELFCEPRSTLRGELWKSACKMSARRREKC